MLIGRRIDNKSLEIGSRHSSKHKKIIKKDEIKIIDYGPFEIIKIYEDVDESIKYGIYFFKTKETTRASKNQILKGNVEDYSIPTDADVGCLGNDYPLLKLEFAEKFGEEMGKKLLDTLYERWRAMLKRCFKESHKSFKDYGGSGVFVDPDWLIFTNYARSVITLEGFDPSNIKELRLDKDKLQRGNEIKIYSQYTCTWLTNKENQEEKYQEKMVAKTKEKCIKNHLPNFNKYQDLYK